MVLRALVWWAHASCLYRSPFRTLRECQNLLILHTWTFLTTFVRNYIWTWGVGTKMPSLSIWRKVIWPLPWDTTLLSIWHILLQILQIFCLVFRKLLKFLSILMNSFNRVCLKSCWCLESFIDLGLPSLLLHCFELFIFLLAIQKFLIKCLKFSAIKIWDFSVFKFVLFVIGPWLLANWILIIRRRLIINMNNFGSNSFYRTYLLALLLLHFKVLVYHKL